MKLKQPGTVLIEMEDVPTPIIHLVLEEFRDNVVWVGKVIATGPRTSRKIGDHVQTKPFELDNANHQKRRTKGMKILIHEDDIMLAYAK